jgi:iron complex outermembrane receptor protein
MSPLAGIVARVTPLASIYANISTAFETPTATELGNQPDGSAGINRELDPQRSLTFEAGVKGYIGGLVRYDAAVFTTSVKDELVPFEIPASDGRRYFRNAGRTKRIGAEVGGDITVGSLTLITAYTYSRFRFVQFTSGPLDFAGNGIPGIPHHRVQSTATLASGPWFAAVDNETSGKSFADDASTFRVPGYSVFHMRGGIAPFRGARRFSLNLSITNVFNRTYASSIAVNAARQRYFEPGSVRSFAAGLSIGTDTAR